MLVTLLLAQLGCATADSGDSAAGDTAACAPALTIVTPQDGDTVCSTAFPVELAITGLTLVDPYNPPDPLPACSGHVDLDLNGVDADMTGTETTTITTAEDGFEYRLKAELSNADHTPMEPYVGQSIFITASAAACDP